MAKAKRDNDNTSHRPVWQDDEFWYWEDVKFQSVVESPADDIRIDHFSSRLAA